jgi:hypothetical protein
VDADANQLHAKDDRDYPHHCQRTSAQAGEDRHGRIISAERHADKRDAAAALGCPLIANPVD